MVLAGCMMVCAALRLMAPQIIASQKWSRRSFAGSAAAVLVAPPRMDVHCSGSNESNEMVGRCFTVARRDGLIPSGPLAIAERRPIASGLSDESTTVAKAMSKKIDLIIILFSVISVMD